MCSHAAQFRKSRSPRTGGTVNSNSNITPSRPITSLQTCCLAIAQTHDKTDMGSRWPSHLGRKVCFLQLVREAVHAADPSSGGHSCWHVPAVPSIPQGVYGAQDRAQNLLNAAQGPAVLQAQHRALPQCRTVLWGLQAPNHLEPPEDQSFYAARAQMPKCECPVQCT